MQIASTDTWQSYRQAFSGQTGSTNAGSASNPYIIDTAGKLAQLAYYVNIGTTYSGKYFKQTADINLGGHEWVPIGGNSTTEVSDASKYFAGTYDGNNYKITGMYIDLPGSRMVGLFGCAKNATIKNLNVEDAYVNGNECVGTIVGLANVGGNNLVDHCSVNAYVTGCGKAGGIAGVIENCKNCVFSGMVVGKEGGWKHAGIAGDCYDAVNCVNEGIVYGTGDGTGGLVGNCYHSIIKSTQAGIVVLKFITPNKSAGLICGSVQTENRFGTITIEDCRADGQIYIVDAQSSDYTYVGAILGRNWDTNNLNITNTSAFLKSNLSAGNYISSSSRTVSITSCYTQVNSTKSYSAGDFSGWSVVPNMNNGLPVQKELYWPAVSSSQTINSSFWSSKGFTYRTS